MRPDELNNSIATKWKTVPLGTIAQFRNGLNYTKENFGRGIKVINVKDFQNHLIASSGKLDEINPDGIVREESLLGTHRLWVNKSASKYVDFDGWIVGSLSL